MGEAEKPPFEIIGKEVKEEDVQQHKPAVQHTSTNMQQPNKDSNHGRYKWWLEMAIYTIFVLAGQSVGTLLGRVYFDKGGKSTWMASLVQTLGFPVLIPFLLISSPKTPNSQTNLTQSSPLILALTYVALGVFLAAGCMLYSVGLLYLPVSTYTLICASQLGFNAVFSFFLNAQKFTPYIINSVVLLTISSILLVFQKEDGDSNSKASKNKYAIGFICTLAASAGFALMLSVTQFVFQRIIKKETLKAILDLAIYQSLVGTLVLLAGLFASGEWKSMGSEMDHFRSGKASYVLNLFWTAVSWQAFSMGSIGLIFKISSLFSNVISILGLPAAPVLAVVFLGDTMTGIKVVAMLLAIWGFVSYVYQHYLDDQKTKKAEKKCLVESSALGVTETERGLAR